MAAYAERDCVRVIIDLTRPERDQVRIVSMASADAGVTWTLEPTPTFETE